MNEKWSGKKLSLKIGIFCDSITERKQNAWLVESYWIIRDELILILGSRFLVNNSNKFTLDLYCFSILKFETRIKQILAKKV
ncbi:MAG: hypothetical protein D6707_02630 [Bacteroidetes bacterium]|nr:MAG: hypothetical protein D6707_02630 [Bacteroidota bacterium]